LTTTPLAADNAIGARSQHVDRTEQVDVHDFVRHRSGLNARQSTCHSAPWQRGIVDDPQSSRPRNASSQSGRGPAVGCGRVTDIDDVSQHLARRRRIASHGVPSAGPAATSPGDDPTPRLEEPTPGGESHPTRRSGDEDDVWIAGAVESHCDNDIASHRARGV